MYVHSDTLDMPLVIGKAEHANLTLTTNARPLGESIHLEPTVRSLAIAPATKVAGCTHHLGRSGGTYSR